MLKAGHMGSVLASARDRPQPRGMLTQGVSLDHGHDVSTSILYSGGQRDHDPVAAVGGWDADEHPPDRTRPQERSAPHDPGDDHRARGRALRAVAVWRGGLGAQPPSS